MNKKTGISGIAVAAIVIVALLILRNVIGGGSVLGSVIKIVSIVFIALLALALIVLILALVTADRKNKDGTGEPDDEQAQLIKNARGELMSLRRAGMKIRNADIRSGADKAAAGVDRILTELKRQPDQLPAQRQFLNYYLPTITQVLKKYGHFEESGVADESVTENAKKYFTDVNAALEKQYENLFSKDKLDMTVEMEAMTIAAKREGLLE